jgi:ubiquinone/menaquinone biosynthesis C-methylase UbiE
MATMEGNLSRFSGFAAEYDSVRPSPPRVLKTLLLSLAEVPRAKLVVDLGSGTGLSTRYWAGSADLVVGIEPNRDMRQRAEEVTAESNVEYREGISSRTGISGRTADIVTCSQSLHWMDPGPTFEEVARVLRQGGIFAAYDCDWPPTTGRWRADRAYDKVIQGTGSLDKKITEANRVTKWAKEEHLKRMAESRRFRYTKEVVIHETEIGDAERFVGILLSQGGIQALLKAGRTEKELGIEEFREECRTVLGDNPREWYWSYRVRIGIR